MKVLIIKLGALGDVVMATPLVEAISKTHPDARIDLITSPGFESILNQWSNVTVYGFERRGWATMARVIKFVRAGRYDRILSLIHI